MNTAGNNLGNVPYLYVELASSQQDIHESQKLRYEIFAAEQGAQLETGDDMIDADYFDEFCHHLLVRDSASGKVVGSTRILTDKNALKAGGFYSQSEFNLGGLLPLNGNAIEIGRTCIHKDYRNGAGIAVLWMGLAQFMVAHKVDYMFGCASVSVRDGGERVNHIMQHIREQQNYAAPEQYQVSPLKQVPAVNGFSGKPQLPPLLKAYLKLGAWVVGEPSLDEEFKVADLFILLDVSRLNQRYHKRFVSGAMASQRKMAAAQNTNHGGQHERLTGTA